jgi:hypothetical protein
MVPAREPQTWVDAPGGEPAGGRLCPMRASDEIADYWNDHAGEYDAEPDHGLGDPATRAAWRGLIEAVLACWRSLLRPGGRFLLVEGRWWSVGDEDCNDQARMPWAGGCGPWTLPPRSGRWPDGSRSCH